MGAANRVPWTRDELILALDLYVREPSSRGNKRHPAVLRLSADLNRIAQVLGIDRSPKYRNPNGVSMTLNSFLRYDKSYRGRGLRGASASEAVWNDYVNDHESLRATAEAILAHARASGGTLRPLADLEEQAFEGCLLARMHLVRERDAAIVSRKKEKEMREKTALRCEACGFDFEARYGSRGRGFAECHHDRPLSLLRPGEPTRLSDLRIVCANCHRIIHRARPWLTIAQVREILKG